MGNFGFAFVQDVDQIQSTKVTLSLGYTWCDGCFKYMLKDENGIKFTINLHLTDRCDTCHYLSTFQICSIKYKKKVWKNICISRLHSSSL